MNSYGTDLIDYFNQNATDAGINATRYEFDAKQIESHMVCTLMYQTDDIMQLLSFCLVSFHLFQESLWQNRISVIVILDSDFDSFATIWQAGARRGMTGAGYAWVVTDRISSIFCIINMCNRSHSDMILLSVDHVISFFCFFAVSCCIAINMSSFVVFGLHQQVMVDYMLTLNTPVC